ncbi:MAG: hypothetical protein A2014_00915 [Spirochaetes bacterium GWF1_49_6]|nr:MAG: hypothetical protein A2014_00915 [Spirochaetes bacterium GWF1_49_6]
MRKGICIGLILAFFNTFVLCGANLYALIGEDSSAQASSQSSVDSSVQSSSESSTDGSCRASSEEASQSSTQASSDATTRYSDTSGSLSTTLAVILIIAGVSLIVTGIITTVKNVTPPQSQQAEISLLIDEAAHINGHNLDVLSKAFNIDKKDVAEIIMNGYLDGEINSVSPQSAMHSKKYLTDALLSKSIEVNGEVPPVIYKLQNDPQIAEALMKAWEENKAPGILMNIIFAY